MIGWFPSPYPDELLYSICARYGEAMQYSNKQFTNVDLLGRGTAQSTIDLPHHLEHLVSALPPNQTYSVDSLVRHHTLFPFYVPFIALERVEKIREMMRAGACRAIHSLAGISTSLIRRPDWLRFCPVCTEQDREHCGETYWRRSHQLPGVEVCPKHMTFLENSCVFVRNPKYIALYVSAEQAIKAMSVNVRPLDREGKSHQVLVRLATDAAWLLNQSLDPDHESLQAGYRTLLMDRGLLSCGGRVRAQKLMQAFRDAYPRALLAALQCDFNEKCSTNWVVLLFCDMNRNKYHHPLRHLLMIQLLRYTAESFFAHCRKEQIASPVIQPRPFSAGPYPCLNPACEFFHQPVIGEITIKPNRVSPYLPTGFFTCSCGFSYARRGPDQSPADQLRYDWVRSYGVVWTALLKEMWDDETITIEEMIRRLRCSLESITHKAISLGLSYPRFAGGGQMNGGSSTRYKLPVRYKMPVKASLLFSPAEHQEEKLRLTNLYCEQLLSAMRQQPEASRTILLKSVGKAYSWLLEHDRDWLMQHLPPRRKQPARVSKIDWAERDERLSQEVRRAAAVIKNSPERPVRLVRKVIARYLGEYYLLTNCNCLAKLPLTLAALNEVVEIRTDFMLRRIMWAEDRLRKEGVVMSFSRFSDYAGVYPKMLHVPEVKAAIEAALISLQSTTNSGKRT